MGHHRVEQSHTYIILYVEHYLYNKEVYINIYIYVGYIYIYIRVVHVRLHIINGKLCGEPNLIYIMVEPYIHDIKEEYTYIYMLEMYIYVYE